jgi:HPt (histidine-containing phosphotransfer) domain-containing protein
MAKAPTTPLDSTRAAAAPDELSELRGTFNKRLREDRGRLIALRATMLHRQEGAKSTFEELHFLAHRMCGASAIFGCPALAAAAHAFIEEHSARRSLQPAESGLPPLLTLDVLIDLLLSMDDRTSHDNRNGLPDTASFNGRP